MYSWQWGRATREVPNSLSPRGQHIKRCNSVAFRRRASLLRKAGTRGLPMSCNGQPDLWGGPSNFPVDGGKLVGQVAYYHFSIRRARGWCVLASVRACVRVNTPVSPGTLAVSPFGIRQGYRGCSGMLVVIGVGRTDHLNTRHCNHDRAPSLSFQLTFSRSVLLFTGLTLLAYRTVIALPHPLPLPRLHPDRTRVAVRGIPPDYYHR